MLLVQIGDGLVQISRALVEPIEPFAWWCQGPCHVLSLTRLELWIEDLQRGQCLGQSHVLSRIIGEVENVESPVLRLINSFNLH